MKKCSCADDYEGALCVFPGIKVSYNNFEEDFKEFHHVSSRSILEINHCHYGRAGWDLNNGTSVYMGEGDVTLHSSCLCSNSVMYFPLGTYQGITITFDFDILKNEMPEIIRNANIDLESLAAAFCKTDASVVFISDERSEQIFAPLYHLPKELELPYLQLKVQELMLFLSRESTTVPQPTYYNSATTEAIRQIHKLITENMATRYTISELSTKYLINTSTLKEVFKAVYGMPIAGYMKEYRMRHAAKLLRHGDDSIADIAASVGYETQSKFTKAFKEVLGKTPSEYRKVG